MYTKFAVVVAFLVFSGPSCTSSDNLALLLETLKTTQQAVCDDDIVSLACPRGTSISIQVAQYGIAPPKEGCGGVTGKAIEGETEKMCKRPNSMQYSLLQTVVEACQKKPSCKFSTKPKPGLVDPCPFAPKYVEVAYKCRPYEFRSLTGCEGEPVKLSCNPRSRIAIFDAQYGRTPYETITCPQTQGIPEETCMAPYAVETVMQICLGKRRCQIKANTRLFESSCKPHTKPYLKVIYACVPLGVLNEKYESAAEKDEIENRESGKDDGNLFDETEGAGERWGEPNPVSPVADPALQNPQEDVNLPPPLNKEVGPAVHPTQNKVDSNKDKTQSNSNLFIYLGIFILIIIIVAVVGLGVHCFISRRKAENSKNGDMFTTEAPNVFNDASSDIDHDMDVSHISGTFYDPVHPDMILYRDTPGAKGTLRAMKPLSTIYPCAGVSMYGTTVDYVPTQPRELVSRFTRSRSKEEDTDAEIMTSPKSLGAYSNSQFYYG